MSKFTRGLEEKYLNQLKTRGELSFLRNKKFFGKDVDIQFRENYINLYYYGASLLKFTWRKDGSYRAEISEAYCKPVPCTVFEFEHTVQGRTRGFKFTPETIHDFGTHFEEFCEAVKANIRCHGWSAEAAFEQLFIDMNLGHRSKPSFLILDRQANMGGPELDVVALSKIPESGKYRLNLVELKYGEDPRIPEILQKQLKPYHAAFHAQYERVVEVYQKVIDQKKAIDRWYYPYPVEISSDPTTMRMIGVFANVDPNGKLVKEARSKFSGEAHFVLKNYLLTEEDLCQ